MAGLWYGIGPAGPERSRWIADGYRITHRVLTFAWAPAIKTMQIVGGAVSARRPQLATYLTLTSPRYRFRRYVQFVSWWQPTAKNRLQGHAEHAPISVHLHLSTVFAWVVFIFCLVEHHFHFWDNNIVIILSTQLLQWSWFLYALETRMFYFSIGFHTNRKWFQPKLVGTLQWGIQDQNWGTKPLLSIR